MRYVRSFLLALTTLAFFLLVLVAGLYVFITPERVSARLANTLSHHLGLKIEMAKLHIDTRLPSLKFTVKDAVLTSADGAVRGSVPSATIRLHPLHSSRAAPASPRSRPPTARSPSATRLPKTFAPGSKARSSRLPSTSTTSSFTGAPSTSPIP